MGIRLSQEELFELVRAKTTLNLIIDGKYVGEDVELSGADIKGCYNCSSDCVSSCQGDCSGDCATSCSSTCSTGCDTVVSNK